MKILLHEFNSLFIEFALDLNCLLIVFIVYHEFIEVLESLLEILLRYLAIVIKVQPQPILLYEDLHIFIMFLNIFNYLGLVFTPVFTDRFDHEGDVVS